MIQREASPSEDVSRRDVFTGAGLAKAAAIATAAAVISRRASAAIPNIICPLLIVYLRGGIDACAALGMIGDLDYQTLRGPLALADPSPGGNIALDANFGLSKAAASLMVPYQNGDLAFALGTGSPIFSSQSHFASQDYSEIGIQSGLGLPQDGKGWYSRYLSEKPASGYDLDGLAYGVSVPLSLKDGPNTLAMVDPEVFDLNGDGYTLADRKVRLTEIYQQADEPAKSAGLDSLAVISDLAQVNFAPTVGNYPAHPLGDALRKTAALFRYNNPPAPGISPQFGPQVAAVDMGGWDNHNDLQSQVGGDYYNRLEILALALRAFYDEMTAANLPFQVLVMSEFGRRVDVNGNLGTDHGRGGLMIAMGDTKLVGGRVYTRTSSGAPGWGGLINQLDPQSGGTTKNLLCNISWWDVMAEFLHRRCGVRPADMPKVFPGYAYNPLGMFV